MDFPAQQIFCLFRSHPSECLGHVTDSFLQQMCVCSGLSHLFCQSCSTRNNRYIMDNIAHRRSAQQPEKSFSLFRLVEAHNGWGEPELTWRQGPPEGNPQTRDQPPSEFRATLVFLTWTLFN